MRLLRGACLVVSMLVSGLLPTQAQENPLGPGRGGSFAGPPNSRDINPPHPTYAPDPEYSEQARKAGLQGSLELTLIVGADGLPHDVRVTKSLGMGLDENSLNAVRTWRFDPARKNGIPVSAQITVEVSFRLGTGVPEEILSKLPTVTTPPVVMRVEECPTRESSRKNEGTEPKLIVADLLFDGAQAIPSEEQGQIAASIKQNSYEGTLQTSAQEISEQVRAAWQNHGYFKVNAAADSRELTSNAISRRIAVTVHIEEGPLYHLGGIAFKNNRAIRSEEALRSLFPIKDGDVFSREKIATGLEALRKAYGEYGYINFTEVPDTEFDDEKGLAYLQIDCDEGKQFYISDVTLIGSDQPSLISTAKDLPFKPGDIYNERLLELFLRKEVAPWSFDDPSRQQRTLDDHAGTIALTFDIRHCPVR